MRHHLSPFNVPELAIKSVRLDDEIGNKRRVNKAPRSGLVQQLI